MEVAVNPKARIDVASEASIDWMRLILFVHAKTLRA